MSPRYGLLRDGDVFITRNFECHQIIDKEGYGFQVDMLHHGMVRKSYPHTLISYGKALRLYMDNPDMRVYQCDGLLGFW